MFGCAKISTQRLYWGMLINASCINQRFFNIFVIKKVNAGLVAEQRDKMLL